MPFSPRVSRVSTAQVVKQTCPGSGTTGAAKIAEAINKPSGNVIHFAKTGEAGA